MKLVNRFTLLLFASIALFSCSDDDAPATPDNKFSVDGTAYKVASGAFLKDIEPGTDTDGDEYYRNDLVLFGEGITVTEASGELVATGQGSIVELMINNAGRELETGTYTWQSEDHEQPFDLWVGYVTIDWQKQSEVEYELVSGTLTVTKSGSTYKATFEGVAKEEAESGDLIPGSEVTISAQFEGSLLQIDREF